MQIPIRFCALHYYNKIYPNKFIPKSNPTISSNHKHYFLTKNNQGPAHSYA